MGSAVPRFSVIVPAHQDQAYLHDCLRSVLTQDFPDFELIAVDDHSPDACGAIFDEAAARDHRVRVVHLPERLGPGPARNAGLRRATGDYLLFLECADVLAPGSLRAIAERLAATGEPELLVHGHAWLHWSGRTTRDPGAALPAPVPGRPEVYRPADHPELLRLRTLPWNTAYRREFVERGEFTFPAGRYAEVPWTVAVLPAAPAVTFLDRVCVHHRLRRHGAAPGTAGPGTAGCDHGGLFDVFDSYDRAFALLDTRPDLAGWRAPLFRRMASDLAALYAAPDRVPPDARAEFHRRARALHRRHHPGPAAFATPAGATPRARARALLLRLGAYRAFGPAHTAARWWHRAARRALAVRRALRTALLGLHHGLQRRLPVDTRLAVFVTYRNGGYTGHPAAIEAKVREMAPHVRTAWVTTSGHAAALPPGVRRIEPDSVAHRTALARARYLVTDAEYVDGLRKRRGQIVLQTHRGTPLGHRGLDLLERPAAARGTDFAKLLEQVDGWDFSLSANPHASLVQERAYPADHITLEYGSPRSDVFHRADAADVARVRADLGIRPELTAVLYAPAHRDHESGRRPRLDLVRLAYALGPGYVLLARAHPRHPEALRAQAADHPRIIDVSAHPRVENLCLAADALVTDYSSLMFDYANLDRPIVLHADDWEIHRATRGVYLDLLSGRLGETPGPVARTEDELIDIFTGGAWRDAHAAELRAAFRERFCPYDDGRVAKRVVRRIFLSEAGSPAQPVVPMSERRPAPAPDGLPLPARDAVPLRDVLPVPGPSDEHRPAPAAPPAPAPAPSPAAAPSPSPSPAAATRPFPSPAAEDRPAPAPQDPAPAPQDRAPAPRDPASARPGPAPTGQGPAAPAGAGPRPPGPVAPLAPAEPPRAVPPAGGPAAGEPIGTP
ncbi:bifunctional glycosyltransferase/CDP-glycerol:glycerophosphate glycerophosphotransferase [Streptomyces pactum]|uniref:bifunctional glycosyltransferase/CDP-glycerol:glycerophosphate glycerophosphotransferase n=1 Tax=Streptomyces pactum TaxID=68249 RepID=UPI0036F6CBD8